MKYWSTGKVLTDYSTYDDGSCIEIRSDFY